MRRYLRIVLSYPGLLVLAAGCQSGERADAPAMGRAQVVSTPYSMPASEAGSPTAAVEITLRTSEHVAVDIWLHRENETPDGKALLGAIIRAKDASGSSYAGPETATLDIFGEDGRRIAQGTVVKTSERITDYFGPDPARNGFALTHGDISYVYEMEGIEPASSVAVGERTSCLLTYSTGKRLRLLDAAITWHED